MTTILILALTAALFLLFGFIAFLVLEPNGYNSSRSEIRFKTREYLASHARPSDCLHDRLKKLGVEHKTSLLDAKTVELLDNINAKSKIIEGKCGSDSQDKGYIFVTETMPRVIYSLISSYKQILINNESSVVQQRTGRTAIDVLDNSLTNISDYLDEILHENPVTLPQLPLSHCINNLIQIEDYLQSRRYENE